MEQVFMLLLLLPLCSCQFHSEYQGTVMTYFPKQTDIDGSVTVEVRYKSNSNNCIINDYYCPPEGCLGLSHVMLTIDRDSSGEFCQTESIWTRRGPSNAMFQMRLVEYDWVNPLINGITRANALAVIELRNRSDTEQANRSPQTTILPILRVPANCQQNVHLLAFDPDGDLVKCRYANNSIHPNECSQCTPPSVLNLLPNCTLSFSPTDNSSLGLYAVQLMMEDFPRTNITLTLTNGTQEEKTTDDTISKVPVQFIFSVEAAAPSCTEGVYLPRFFDPTPEHGAQLDASVNQTLQINIKAEANVSMISELLFSGPSKMTETNSGGQYILSWTPVESEVGQSHPVCFVIQAVLNTTKFTSELRCVIVTVGNVTLPTAPPTVSTTTSGTENLIKVKVFMKARISSSGPLFEEDIRTTVLPQFKQELVKRGLPPDITLSLVNGTSTAPPAGSP